MYEIGSTDRGSCCLEPTPVGHDAVGGGGLMMLLSLEDVERLELG